MAWVVKQVNRIGCFASAVKSTFTEYAGISTIQGFQYLVDPKGNICSKSVMLHSSPTERPLNPLKHFSLCYSRFIWILVCAFGILNATLLMFTFWERHVSNPTQISIESNHAYIPELEFPSITFCHINQISVIRTSRLLETL